MKGKIVIGEGELDEAPMLYIGEKLGNNNGPELDIAVDPLEGTNFAANNLPGALSVISISAKSNLFNAPETYMNKISANVKEKNVIDLDYTVKKNIYNLAQYKNKRPDELTTCILDRPRHKEIIENLKKLKVNLKLISDGDVSGALLVTENKYNGSYNIRFDPHENYMKNQSIDFSLKNSLGDYKIAYLDQKSKTEEIIVTDKETLNYEFASKKLFKYSKISYKGLYDLKKSINTESGISYSYFDECFGINIDFKRNSYSEEALKPQDIMTIMFSFKNLGSYKSTNLAVSETDKQDIEWESISVDNDLFN